MLWVRNNNSIEKRLKLLEDYITELTDEVTSLKMRLLSISTKYAVTKREDKKQSPLFEEMSNEELLKAILKGEPISKLDLHGVRSDLLNDRKNSSASDSSDSK